MFTCETCRRAELTPLQRIKEDVLTAVLGPTTDRALRIYGATFTAVYTGRTPYDRHREEFERTGDTQELHRMLRHVTPEGT